MNKSLIHLCLLVSAAMAAALTACGGGGSDSGGNGVTPTAAAGLYEKTGGGVPAIEVLVLDSGRIYAIYGTNSTAPVPAGGVIVADAATTSTSLASSNVHDFNLSAHTVSTGTAAGTYAAKTSVNLTMSYGAGSISTLSANYGNTYEKTPSLSALAGTYGGETGDLGGTKVTAVTVNGAGVLTGATSDGCAYAGVVTPHARGNVFDVTMNFQTGCAEAGNTLRGHAFVSNNVLYVVVVNGDLSRGVLFAGVKS